MDNNQCPQCNAELAGTQECPSCGFNPAGQSGLAPPPTQSLGEARNVRPPSPPIQTPQATPNAGDQHQQQPDAHVAQTPRMSRAAAPPDPGRPFLSREMHDLKPIAEKYIKQKTSRKGGKNVAVGGDYSETHRTKIGKLNAIFNESRERRSDVKTVSLMDVTSLLPDREQQIPSKTSYELDPHVKSLKEQHVLFMSCVDERVAFGAAYALLDELKIVGEQRLFLNFSRNAEKSNAVIHFFTQSASEDRRELTAIVIDGFNAEARGFLDWLRGTFGHALDVRSHLHGHGFFLLCLVDPEYLQKYSGAKTFETWPVPFLQPLLKHNFPGEADSLEKEILIQQQFGKWKQTEAELCGEIRELLESDLPKIVAQRRNSVPIPPPSTVPPIGPESIFKGGHSIEDTLLYAATYFSDLPPHEFDQLVEWLLADRTTTVTIKTPHHNPDGAVQIIETEVQKPLREFWAADPDSYLTTCELEAAVSGQNLTTSIKFANDANREKLKAHLEKHHSLYLLRQFRILESNNFLTSAPHISDCAMSLSIDMALAYPGSFGKEWLLKIVVDARNGSKPLPHTDNATITIGKNKALERITLFVRLMLEKPQLEEVVNGLLKDLMSLGCHETVLFLVRGLQFAPGFDEFHWMKRLLDEGDKDIKDDTYYHLYSYIQKIGIHSLLSKLESWLPSDDRLLDNYSPSCIYSLRLLVEYCSEVTETYEREQAPPRHPLFTFTDDKVARENCRRLIRWFFHPGMPAVFADLDSVFMDDRTEARVLPFISELVLEWMVVLREQEGSSTDDEDFSDGVSESSANGEQFMSSERTRDFLIESLAVNTAPNQRGQMLLYWERLRDFMGLIVNLSDASSDWFGSLNSEEKKAILTTRRLVKELIKRFRTAIRAAKLRNGRAVITI